MEKLLETRHLSRLSANIFFIPRSFLPGLSHKKKQLFIPKHSNVSDCLRQLQLLKKYRLENETSDIVELTVKWKSVGQQVSEQLFQIHEPLLRNYLQQHSHSSLIDPFQFEPDGHELSRQQQEEDDEQQQQKPSCEVTLRKMFDVLGLDISLLDYDNDENVFIPV